MKEPDLSKSQALHRLIKLKDRDSEILHKSQKVKILH